MALTASSYARLTTAGTSSSWLSRSPSLVSARRISFPLSNTFFGSILLHVKQIDRKALFSKNSVPGKVRSQAVTNEQKDSGVRVRFAPSPTGNLHVGGARTALFNWLFARAQNGKFILRIEDTDLERSTRASEEMVLRDLRWLGLNWDEGPDVGGEFGPYRQSERNQIYQDYAKKLLASGQVYRCFCTDAELEAMREEQEAKKLPPKYAGKWARASDAEVQAELEKGTPFTYRFRVPQDRRIVINDLIRDEVAWNTDTLGDFVVLRSNGQPVYNFCVAVDDATMKISHVIRAEEHLPNTLRQALIYEALGFPMPQFGHVSLILAPDRSKLSKRHGATSVGQFKEMGYLPEAMVNYLALLGWNDGTEEEIFSPSVLVEKFGIDRLTKSAAIFDQTKLGWMNGQHLQSLPDEKLTEMIGERWVQAGILSRADEDFVKAAVDLVKGGVELVTDYEEGLKRLLDYPLAETLASVDGRTVVEDNLKEMADVVLASYEDGSLQEAIQGGHDTWQKWVKGLGKPLKRKGKRLFMPIRILLTGSMQGPDVGSTLALLHLVHTNGIVAETVEFVPLGERMEKLKQVDWEVVLAKKEEEGVEATAEAEVSLSAR